MNASLTALRDEYRRLRRLLVAICAAVVGAAIAAAALYLWAQYQEAKRAATAQSATLTRALEEHVLRTFAAIDIQLRNTGSKLVQTRALERPSSAALVELLRQDKLPIDFVVSLYAYDAGGRGHTSSMGVDIGRLHARDSEHFREILDGGTDRRVVGRVADSPVTRRPSIHVARGLVGGDGRFAGIIGTAIEPAYFEQFYKELALGVGASVTLLRGDGAVLARFPDPPGATRDVSGSAIFREHVSRQSSGILEGRAAVDGSNRLISFRHVPGWNLIVTHTRLREEVFAPWWRLAPAVGLATLALVGAALTTLWFVLRLLKRRAEVEERFALAEVGSNDGIWDWNLLTHETYLSPRWKEIFGYRDDELPNVEASFFDLIDPEDRARADQALARHLEHGEPYAVELRMRHKDGSHRWILARGEALRDAAGRAVRMAGSTTDISERKRAEQTLHESDERFSKAFHGSPIANAIRRLRDDVLLDVNPAFCAMLGLSREQVVGRTVAEINFYTHHEKRRAVTERTARREPIYGLETEVRSATGAVVQLLMTVDYTVLNGEDCALASFVDISERKRVENALRESEAIFAKAFHNNPVAMGIRRLSDDVIVDVNASFEKALGYRRDEVIGKTVSELNFYFSPRERAAALDGAGSREPIRERDVALRSRQGAVVQTILTTDYVTLGGAECALTSFLDITARRQAEDRVRASLREKDVLLKEIYHRVKNNMQVVASLLSLQARGAGDGATRQLLQDSASRIKSMALVHEQLYQGGDLSSIDFAAYLGQLTHHLREVHGEVAERAPIIVQAEPVQLGLETAVPLGLIVNELVSNAYKHAFPGGRRGQVRLRLGWVGEGLIELVVGDDGAGLPQGFEPGQGGSLGMQLVLSLAEQLGGTVVHGRNGDAGSRFALRFAPERAEAERLAAVDTGPGA